MSPKTSPKHQPGESREEFERDRQGQTVLGPSAETPAVLRVRVADLVPNLQNGRTHYDETGLKELAASIQADGLLQPLLVRPIDGSHTYQVIAGHRRLKALQLLDAEHVMVQAILCTDAEAANKNLAENIQREGLDPLDEAHALKRLLEGRETDVPELSRRLGKSTTYLYERLSLLDLLPAAAALLKRKAMPLKLALQLARLTPEVQRLALEDLKSQSPDGGKTIDTTVANFKEWLQEEVFAELKTAPFDTNDALLVNAAGACSTCPKRTGNAPALFADVKSKDTCTDPKCFSTKVTAFIERRMTEEPRPVPLVEYGEDTKTKYGVGLRSHEYETVTAKTPGAVPGLYVQGWHRGKVIWIKKGTRDLSRAKLADLTPQQQAVRKKQRATEKRKAEELTATVRVVMQKIDTEWICRPEACALIGDLLLETLTYDQRRQAVLALELVAVKRQGMHDNIGTLRGYLKDGSKSFWVKLAQVLIGCVAFNRHDYTEDSKLFQRAVKLLDVRAAEVAAALVQKARPTRVATTTIVKPPTKQAAKKKARTA